MLKTQSVRRSGKRSNKVVKHLAKEVAATVGAPAIDTPGPAEKNAKPIEEHGGGVKEDKREVDAQVGGANRVASDIEAADGCKQTLLHHATWTNLLDAMIGLLEKGANVDAQDIKGQAPLHWATSHGNVDSMRLLIKWGANVNVKDIYGLTPLHWAAIWNADPSVVDVLLEHDADVSVKSAAGMTPLYIANLYSNAKSTTIIYDALTKKIATNE